MVRTVIHLAEALFISHPIQVGIQYCFMVSFTLYAVSMRGVME